MGKHLLKKNILFTATGIACALLIGACVMPANLDGFLDDNNVQTVIRRNLVNLHDRTANRTLTAGNQRITGLNPNNYYLVKILEELADPDDSYGPIILSVSSIPEDIPEDGYESQGFWFVSRDGTLLQAGENANLAPLGRVSGGAIAGLDNDLTYIVWNAVPLQGYVSISSDFPGLMFPNLTRITDGTIPLPSLPPDYHISMALSPAGTGEPAITLEGNYTIVRVPVIPDAAVSTVMTSPAGTSTVLSLQTVSKVDYVFIEYDEYDNVVSFRVLRVIMEDVPNLRLLTISLLFTAPADYSPVVQTITFDTDEWEIQGTGGQTTVDISIDNANLLDENSITWSVFDPVSGEVVYLLDADGYEVGYAHSFTLNFNEESHHAYMFTLPGIHHINIEARRDGRTYSGTVVITTLPLP